jgi:preprotein translocase subunit YajC
VDLSFLLILGLAFVALWLMTGRTRKQQREAADFRANLAEGDEVMTASGLFGTVVAVDDDVVTLESTPGSQTRWLRAAIAKRVDAPVADELDDEDEADELEDELEDDAHPAIIEVPDDLSALTDGPDSRDGRDEQDPDTDPKK